jgi:hypothetical protein
MYLEKLSSNFTPRQQGIFFAIDTERDEPTDIVVEIINCEENKVVAMQTLRNVTTAKVNIAPYINFPTHYESGECQELSFMDMPTFRYAIRVEEIESEEVVLTVNRTEIEELPAIVTSQPLSRHISLGEYDEMLIVAEPYSEFRAEITTDLGESVSVEQYCTSGVTVLTIPTEEFDPATRSFDLRIECGGEEIGAIHYAIAPHHKGAVRMAWLSDEGTIERYTFPISSRSFRSVSKRTTSMLKGEISSQCNAKQSITVCSRYESTATINALAQIVHSPKVWVEQANARRSVEVITSSIEYSLFGAPVCIALDICLWQKEVAL